MAGNDDCDARFWFRITRRLCGLRRDHVAALEAADTTRRFELGEAPAAPTLPAPIGQRTRPEAELLDRPAVRPHERDELLDLLLTRPLAGLSARPRRREALGIPEARRGRHSRQDRPARRHRPPVEPPRLSPLRRPNVIRQDYVDIPGFGAENCIRPIVALFTFGRRYSIL